MPTKRNITRRTILTYGLLGRCPRCGAPLSFRSRFWINHACPRCGLRYQRSEGFFLGAWVWNYGLTVFGMLPMIILLLAYDLIGGRTAVALGVLISLAAPILLYRYAWSLWLMSYYFILIDELRDYPDESADN